MTTRDPGGPSSRSPFEIDRSLMVGDTADIYLHRTLTILRNEGVNPEVTMEFYPATDGIFCGITEVKALLAQILPETGREVWALEEGVPVVSGEIAARIRAPYASFGLYETAICGTLASCTGWSTAAHKCADAAVGIPIVALGARHIHPSVVGVMDYSAVVGGAVSCSSILGARLAGVSPSGTMPHALVLVIGDTIRSVEAFDRHMPPEVPRVAVVDTFKDEAEEALEVSRALRDKLRGVRLDTPKERGGVTSDLVKEVRARLDQAGFTYVDVIVTGGMTPERIEGFVKAKAPVDVFGVGHYIAAASPIAFTGDIRVIEGRPVAKRGRIPGRTDNPRLTRVL